MSVSELPTLVPGVDAPPRRCHGCGSALLSPEEPLAGGHFGVLTCSLCGRTLAALGRPLRRAPRRVEPARPPLPAPSPVVERGMIQGRFRRVPGCGVTCGALHGHDPAPHVEHGRALERDALDVRHPRPTGTVRTGCLTVDFDAGSVAVDGHLVALSETEWHVLAHLAARLGRLCWYEQVVADVWSATTWAAWASRGTSMGRQHVLRVHLARLRGKLGPAGALIETVPSRGLVLLARPPEGGSHDD